MYIVYGQGDSVKLLLFFVLAGALYPEERLHIDQVARAQIAKVSTNSRRELKATKIDVPPGPRFIGER